MAIADILFMSDTDTEVTMDVGSIVIPLDTADMVSLGIPKIYSPVTGVRFGFAIVVSMSPFILVSEAANMRWASSLAINFKAVGKCTPDALTLANTRLTA